MFGIKKDNEFSKCCSAPVKRSPKIDGYKPYCTKCQKQCEIKDYLTIGEEGSGKVFRYVAINGLDLYDLLEILKDKEISIIELSENTQSLFEGNSDKYNCERVKYEVLKFEKVIYDESYMITVRNLTS
ncbi:hypothetical protein [Clostridium sp. VAP23]|uniref:hypothetical protein n=1 Tax=Clostridium sp. VAP23 TaxID=2949981 RepID=UPI00207A6DBC|nr:hypothetical protein [Clostridium sp. VAP23]